MNIKDSDTLHGPNEPKLQGGRLYSMLDLMGPQITCDLCGSWQRLSAITVDDARKDAAAKGWVEREGKDLCRNCAQASA